MAAALGSMCEPCAVAGCTGAIARNDAHKFTDCAMRLKHAQVACASRVAGPT